VKRLRASGLVQEVYAQDGVTILQIVPKAGQ
jgi:hypothetical protein